MTSAHGVDLEADLQAPGRARRFVSEILATASPGVLANARLAASELVTNAVLHGRPPLRLSVEVLGPRVRLSVRDASEALPAVVEAEPTATSGRGLHIIDLIAERWGVVPHHGGKTVWCEVSC